jgi:hypothetical protein
VGRRSDEGELTAWMWKRIFRVACELLTQLRESSHVIRKDMSWSFARCLSNERIIGVWKCFGTTNRMVGPNISSAHVQAVKTSPAAAGNLWR